MQRPPSTPLAPSAHSIRPTRHKIIPGIFQYHLYRPQHPWLLSILYSQRPWHLSALSPNLSVRLRSQHPWHLSISSLLSTTLASFSIASKSFSVDSALNIPYLSISPPSQQPVSLASFNITSVSTTLASFSFVSALINPGIFQLRLRSQQPWHLSASSNVPGIFQHRLCSHS